MRRPTTITLPMIAAVVISACATGDGRDLAAPVFAPPVITTTTTTLPNVVADRVPTTVFELVAPWQDGTAVAVRHTCDGAGLPPALNWSGVPADAVELAVTAVDLDALDFVHWIVFGIDPATTGLGVGDQRLPGTEGPNSAGTLGWTAPCPPAGDEHVYQFTVHALDRPLTVGDEASPVEILAMLNLLAIDQAWISGTYARAAG
ncbi:MAG TPA: YbhB/YbcL family Raf kinase inhibitor-like protein [Ilumatobacter sp.]